MGEGSAPYSPKLMRKVLSVLMYASQKPQKHEKNYPPFLLKLQAVIKGNETLLHFKKRLTLLSLL
jgi:hypothetical protein